MKRKIVLAHIVTDATMSYSHGLASLAAVLLENGYNPDEIKLVTIKTNNFKFEAKEILNADPFIILFTCMSNQWDKAKQIAAILKKEDSNIPLCIGGPHVTALPSSILDSSFDVGITGEAEDIINLIVKEALKGSGRSKATYQNIIGSRRLIENLDELPLPNISIFNIDDILQYPSVMFSRGCPFKCSYCMSRKGGYGGNIRWKSPKRAIGEILQLIDYANPDEIYIDDDTFLKNPKWAREFCILYKQKVKLPFFCNARPETVTAETVQYLKGANCHAIGIGIESGSSRIRKDILQREVSKKTMIQSFDIAHKAGLKTWAFNMVGIPTETPEDLLATIRLNEAVKTDYVRISIFTPYPGTPIFKLCAQPEYNKSYFRKKTDLSIELQVIYNDWLAKLATEKRLWFTETENKQILQ